MAYSRVKSSRKRKEVDDRYNRIVFTSPPDTLRKNGATSAWPASFDLYITWARSGDTFILGEDIKAWSPHVQNYLKCRRELARCSRFGALRIMVQRVKIYRSKGGIHWKFIVPKLLKKVFSLFAYRYVLFHLKIPQCTSCSN